MLKIWAKLIIDEKIVKSEVFNFGSLFSEESFKNCVAEICHNYDIPTPMVLSKHVSDYLNFNIATFIKTDFVESVNFDEFVLENAFYDE